MKHITRFGRVLVVAAVLLFVGLSHRYRRSHSQIELRNTWRGNGRYPDDDGAVATTSRRPSSMAMVLRNSGPSPVYDESPDIPPSTERTAVQRRSLGFLADPIDYVVTYVNGTEAALAGDPRGSMDSMNRLTDWNELWHCLYSIFLHGRLCIQPEVLRSIGDLSGKERCLRGNVYLVIAKETHIPFWITSISGRANITNFQRFLLESVKPVLHRDMDPCLTDGGYPEHATLEEQENYRHVNGCHGVRIRRRDLELGLFSSSVIEVLLPFIPGLSEHFIYMNNDQVLGRELLLIGDLLSRAQSNALQFKTRIFSEGPESTTGLFEALKKREEYDEEKTWRAEIRHKLSVDSSKVTHLEALRIRKPMTSRISKFEMNHARCVELLTIRQAERRVALREITFTNKFHRSSCKFTTYQFAHYPRFYHKMKLKKVVAFWGANHTDADKTVLRRCPEDLFVPLLSFHEELLKDKELDATAVQRNEAHIPFISGFKHTQIFIQAGGNPDYAFWSFSSESHLDLFTDEVLRKKRQGKSLPVFITLNDDVPDAPQSMSKQGSIASSLDSSAAPTGPQVWRLFTATLDIKPCDEARNMLTRLGVLLQDRSRAAKPRSLRFFKSQSLLLQAHLLFCELGL